MKEFKVGDWVRHIESNNIYKINGFSIHGQTKGFIQIPDEYNLVPQSECELWQPKEGEWCWSKTRNELTNNVCELIRFYWDNANIGDCEPFIGELPSFLKEQ